MGGAVLTQLIRFGTEKREQHCSGVTVPREFRRSSGTSNCVNNLSLIRLHSFEAHMINVLEKVRTYTGSRCESIASPLRSDAL